MASAPPASIERIHITRTPGVCGGKACIAGSRIRVSDIYIWHERQGKSPDEIVSEFPQLTLADVYAALTYFWDHRDELLEQMKEADELVSQTRLRFQSKLFRKPGNLGDALPS